MFMGRGLNYRYSIQRNHHHNLPEVDKRWSHQNRFFLQVSDAPSLDIRGEKGFPT